MGDEAMRRRWLKRMTLYACLAVAAELLVGCAGTPANVRSEVPRVAPPDVEQAQRFE